MPLQIEDCDVNAELQQGASNFAALQDDRTFPAGRSRIDRCRLDRISLIGVPGSIRGPYIFPGDAKFSNEELVIEGPFRRA